MNEAEKNIIRKMVEMKILRADAVERSQSKSLDAAERRRAVFDHAEYVAVFTTLADMAEELGLGLEYDKAMERVYKAFPQEDGEPDQSYYGRLAREVFAGSFAEG